MRPVPDGASRGDREHEIPLVVRAVQWSAVAARLLGMTALGSVAPAHADVPNAITAYVQPMSGCQVGRMGVMFYQGLLGAPLPIAADPAGNAPLWAGTGYALCWTTAAGATLPAGSDCAPTGTAIAIAIAIATTSATPPLIASRSRSMDRRARAAARPPTTTRTASSSLPEYR